MRRANNRRLDRYTRHFEETAEAEHLAESGIAAVIARVKHERSWLPADGVLRATIPQPHGGQCEGGGDVCAFYSSRWTSSVCQKGLLDGNDCIRYM